MSDVTLKLYELAYTVRRRLTEERGQTAAEYMGILLVVAVIIGALIAADVDGKIATAAGEMIDKIKGGNEKR
jgi:Flp pilus assembly pilin Flp